MLFAIAAADCYAAAIFAFAAPPALPPPPYAAARFSPIFAAIAIFAAALIAASFTRHEATPRRHASLLAARLSAAICFRMLPLRFPGAMPGCHATAFAAVFRIRHCRRHTVRHAKIRVFAAMQAPRRGFCRRLMPLFRCHASRHIFASPASRHTLATPFRRLSRLLRCQPILRRAAAPFHADAAADDTLISLSPLLADGMRHASYARCAAACLCHAAAVAATPPCCAAALSSLSYAP